jgi:hypothetical protein
MEDENPHSPFFGITPLKRLSRVRTTYLPLSRETFNAFEGTVVKWFFSMILANCIQIDSGKSSGVWKCQNPLYIWAIYFLGSGYENNGFGATLAVGPGSLLVTIAHIEAIYLAGVWPRSFSFPT